MTNDNIDIFDQKLNLVLQEYQDEETKVYRDSATLKKNNKSRILILRDIRSKKLQEIEEAFNENEKKYWELEEARIKILDTYCQIHGHNYLILSEKIMESSFNKHSFRSGFDRRYLKKYKCMTCGAITCVEGKISTDHAKLSQPYKQLIPDEIYDDYSLAINNKTYRMIIEEQNKCLQYKDYLNFLRGKLCYMFGHDLRMDLSIGNNYYCSCCHEYVNKNQIPLFQGVMSNPNFSRELNIDYQKLPEEIVTPIEEFKRKLNKK